MENTRIEEFREYLIDKERSINTIDSYIRSIKIYFEKYNEVNKANLIDFKKWLLETKNQRLLITE